MNSLAEVIFDTIVGLFILAICIANLMNFIGYVMYEEAFGFGTLKEKSLNSINYTVDTGEFVGYSQMQYYMLPVVDTQNERTMYQIHEDGTYNYSTGDDANMVNMYRKILPVLENTENRGGLNQLKYSIFMDANGTLRFQRE